MEDGDLDVLCDYIVDYVVFSYYFFCLISVDLEKNKEIEGNVFVILKNLYLKVSEWGW